MGTIKKWYAWLLGYFWKPCPSCGKMFAGFEVTEKSKTIDVGGRSFVVCGECSK